MSILYNKCNKFKEFKMEGKYICKCENCTCTSSIIYAGHSTLKHL